MPKDFISDAEMEKLAKKPKDFISDEEMEGLSQVQPSQVSGELPALERARLSFASGPEEEKAALEKFYPGAKVSEVPISREKKERVVRLPGEEHYRYIDQPGFTGGDIAGMAGMIPSVGAGLLAAPTVAGAAAAGAAGEAARKGIGRYVLGIPSKAGAARDVADIGFGAAGAAGGQWLGGKIGGLLGRFGKKPPAPTAAAPDVPAPGVPIQPKPPIVAPKSSAELVERAKTLKPEATELPATKRWDEIKKQLPDLENPFLGVHDDVIKGGKESDILRAMKQDVGSAEGQALRQYESAIKNELTQKTQQEIAKIGGRAPRPSPQAGQSLIESAKSAYKANQDRLAPLFQQMQNARLPKVKHIPQLKNRVETGIPSLKGKIDVDEFGNLVLPEFSPKLGMTPEAYKDVTQVLRDLNSESLTFGEMQSMREFLRQRLDPMNPKATRAQEQMRKVMLDHMADLMQQYRPKLNVKQTFKEYAVNEKNLANLERVFGGKLESMEQMALAAPERVLTRIFDSTNSVKATREALGDDAFNKLTTDFVGSLAEKATDRATGQFSSRKFANLLRQYEPELKMSIPKQQWDRLSALVDAMKVIPDAPPFNPSGTGPFMGITRMLRGGKAMFTGDAPGVAQQGAGLIEQKMARRQGIKELDAALRGTAKAAPKEKGLIRKKAPMILGGELSKGFLDKEESRK